MPLSNTGKCPKIKSATKIFKNIQGQLNSQVIINFISTIKILLAKMPFEKELSFLIFSTLFNHLLHLTQIYNTFVVSFSMYFSIFESYINQDFLIQHNFFINMNQQIPQTLRILLQQLENRDVYLKALSQGAKIYYLTPYKINKITPIKILKLFQILSKKFYTSEKPVNISWYQNQLKIFVWLIVGYCYLKKYHINQLDQEDWEFFSKIFSSRSVQLIEFQAKSLIRIPVRQISWVSEQTDLLFSIIHKKDKLKWHQIALQFFIDSNRSFFRTAKQCRQQWLNHLDPIKIRTEWRLDEDIVLLEAIFQIGKKWAQIAKLLNSTRTEHMVKNRYKSLIKNYSKEYAQHGEQQLLELAIQDLNKKKKHIIQQQKEIYGYLEQYPQKIKEDFSLKSSMCFQSFQESKHFKLEDQVQNFTNKNSYLNNLQSQINAGCEYTENIDQMSLLLR